MYSALRPLTSSLDILCTVHISYETATRTTPLRPLLASHATAQNSTKSPQAHIQPVVSCNQGTKHSRNHSRCHHPTCRFQTIGIFSSNIEKNERSRLHSCSPHNHHRHRQHPACPKPQVIYMKHIFPPSLQPRSLGMFQHVSRKAGKASVAYVGSSMRRGVDAICSSPENDWLVVFVRACVLHLSETCQLPVSAPRASWAQVPVLLHAWEC
jgi:hypothetical protein